MKWMKVGLSKSYPLGNDHISPTTKAPFQDDFPAFPFGGICDRSLQGSLKTKGGWFRSFGIW